MGWRANPWHGSRGGHAGHVAHQVLGSRPVQHVVRHYAPTRSTTRIAHQVLGSRGVQHAARHGQVVLNRRAARVLRLSQRRLPVQATVRTPALLPTLRLATRQPSSVFAQSPVQATTVAQVPHVAIPNVFHTRIAPITFRPAQNAAARFVERSVAKVPGRARPPRFPALRHYTAGQRRYINRAVQRYGRAAARDRGYQSAGAASRAGVNLGGQIAQYGEPQAKRALAVYQPMRTPTNLRPVRPGRYSPVGPRDASGDFAAILSGGVHPVAGMSLAAAGRAVNKGFIAPSVKGTLDLAANTPGAIYNTGAAGFEALHGDFGRAKRLAHDFVNNDPIALLVQGRTHEAWKAVARNPVAATLEVLGVKGLAGRSVGRVQRAAGGSREAAPAVLEGTGIVQRRPYSRDAITRKRQIAQDKGRVAVSRHFAQQAAQAASRGALDEAKRLVAKARAWSPHHITDHQVHRRVDERVHANEMVRRALRGLAMHRAQRHVVSRRKGGALMSLLAQGIVHPHVQDIQAYLTHLDQRYHSGQLSPAQAFSNRVLAKEVRGALGSKHLNLPDLHARAKAFAVEQAAIEAKLVDSGLLDAAQAEKARLIPYAVRRMGASHNGDRIIGPGGQFLSSAAIKQHMLANGVNPDEVAYLSQAPNARGARNFYMNTLQRHVIPDLRRTGEATRNGTFDPHPQTFVEQAAREANLLAADHGFKGLIGEFAIRHPNIIPNPTESAEQRAAALAKAEADYHYHRNQSTTLRYTQHPEYAGGKILPNSWRVYDHTADKFIEHGLTRKQADDLVLNLDPGFSKRTQTHLNKANAAEVRFKQLAAGGGTVTHPKAGEVMQFGTKRSAQLWIDDQHAQGARGLRAVRVNPFLGKQKDLEHVIEAVNSNREVPASILDQVNAAVDHSADGAGPWAVIHDTAAHRLQQHLSLQRPIPGLRGMQKVNQAFRNAVLPLSTKWITGNVVEAGFRTALARAGPLSYLTGRRVLGELDRQHTAGTLSDTQMLEARARTVGGGHFAMAEQTSVHRGADQFEHSVLRPVAHALGAVAKAPGPRNVGNLWQHYTHFVFSANGAMERQFQTALAGRYLRDMKPTRGELALSRRAVEQAAHGLKNTNEQVQMGRFIDRAYGKYGKFNPTERFAISYYTPFIAWSLNAIKFVTSVLPKDHPVATGLLVAAHNASQQWLKDHGLNLWMQNAAPGWLQGSLPTAGGKVRAGRYLPFGFFGDPAQQTAGVLMPQYASAYLALNGLDWKGESLTGPGGGTPDQGKKFGSALEAFLGGTVPILGQVQQVATKKGPLGQKLQRQFNPFYPVQNTATGGAAAGPHDAKIDKALQNLPSGGGQFDQKIDRALKNAPGGAEGMGKRLAGYSAGKITRPSKAYVRSFLASPAGKDYRLGKGGFLVPKGAKHSASLPSLASNVVYKARLFAHPQRSGTGLAGVSQVLSGTVDTAAAIAAGRRVSAPSSVPAGKPGAVLSRFSRYGVKDTSGRVLIPAKHARGIIHNFSQLGYGHGQIVDFLAHGKPRKQLGVPAQVTRAMQVLKHVSVGAVVPQNKSYYSPSDISKMAQSHGAPKWLADALGATSVHESRGIPRGPGSVSNSPGGGSRGLLQINPAAWGGANHLNLRGNYGKLFNPDYNVRAALYVVSRQGSSAWSASGTWRGPAVPPGRFNFPVPEKQKRAARLTPHQRQAERVARRAARAWTSAGQAPVPHKVPAQIRAMLGHIPTQRAKGGPSLKELPKPVRRFLKRYLPQPAAASGVSSPSNTSGVPVSTSSPGVSAGVASGKASGGKASALSALPAADAAALAQLLAPQQGPVLATPLQAPAFSAGAVFPSGYTAGQVSLADILQRITGRARV